MPWALFLGGVQSECLFSPLYHRGVVTYACTRCDAAPDQLDKPGLARSRGQDAIIDDTYRDDFWTMWNVFGIDGHVEVCGVLRLIDIPC
jgi:hypothetical protein